MVVQLYSVWDRAAEEFLPVFQAKNDAVALRAFEMHVTRESTHPEDLSLWRVGEFRTDFLRS